MPQEPRPSPERTPFFTASLRFGNALDADIAAGVGFPVRAVEGHGSSLGYGFFVLGAAGLRGLQADSGFYLGGLSPSEWLRLPMGAAISIGPSLLYRVRDASLHDAPNTTSWGVSGSLTLLLLTLRVGVYREFGRETVPTKTLSVGVGF
jgi:hypothetical protein